MSEKNTSLLLKGVNIIEYGVHIIRQNNYPIVTGNSFTSKYYTRLQIYVRNKHDRGCIFSCVQPFYEQAVSNLDP
jgi:hypothetical protein